MLPAKKIPIHSNFPDLADIQINSFRWFLSEGWAEVLDFFPLITDPTGKLELQFFGKEFLSYQKVYKQHWHTNYCGKSKRT